mmetsp:Transcript_48912/g.126118  ORF Transcript_48912/g.126118 Transcript_48912/m.126118 type:complete len:211 (-) Transcript_48912:882-1514(-)
MVVIVHPSVMAASACDGPLRRLCRAHVVLGLPAAVISRMRDSPTHLPQHAFGLAHSLPQRQVSNEQLRGRRRDSLRNSVRDRPSGTPDQDHEARVHKRASQVRTRRETQRGVQAQSASVRQLACGRQQRCVRCVIAGHVPTIAGEQRVGIFRVFAVAVARRRRELALGEAAVFRRTVAIQAEPYCCRRVLLCQLALLPTVEQGEGAALQI